MHASTVTALGLTVSRCKICGSDTVPIGVKRGRLRQADFFVRHCDECGFSFVANPWLDYGEIYSEDYYSGKGADPSVDYLFELEYPDQTVRQYEWRGIVAAINDVIPLRSQTRWLDFGCGNGGLIQYCARHTECAPFGFEEGWIRAAAGTGNDRYLSRTQLEGLAGTFDVVTAIEVLEHICDPLEVLRQIRCLLKPHGLLFLTTGNAEVFRHRLLEWSYLVPEIHVSLFEPRTLKRALEVSGFRPEFRGFGRGFEDILRFKILKNAGVRRSSALERVLPWKILSRIADSRYRVSAHPVGWAI